MTDNLFDPRGDDATCEICGEPVDDASVCDSCLESLEGEDHE